MKAFLSYMNMGTPDELILLDPITAEDKIIEYIEYLKNEKMLSRSSIEGVCAPLSKFYAMNRITLNWKLIHNYLPEHVPLEDKAYTHDQIKQLLDSTTKSRQRVAIYLMCSTGLRIGGLSGLRKKDLVEIKEYKVYQITVYPQDNERYITFCTPECATEINKYFEYRRQCGEDINDDSPVIRDDFDRNISDNVRDAQPTTIIAMKNMIEGIVENAGLKMPHLIDKNGNVSQRTEIMVAHGIRKFFDTNLIAAKVHKLTIESLMGWNAKRGLQRNYDRTEIQELLNAYVNAIPHLTISKEQKLQTENTELRAKNDEITEVKSELGKAMKALYESGILKKD